MILVTGATGKVGRELVKLLLADGQNVAAVTRDRGTAAMPGGVDVVVGDPHRPKTVASALRSVESLFRNIVHRDKTRWSVEAGPFEVRVTGTQFDVAWDPSHRQLTIALLEGSVAVSGCDLAHPRVVAAGETFQATCDEDGPVSTQSPTSAPVPTPVRPTEAPPTVVPRRSHAASAPPPAAATSAGFAQPESPTWREVLALGRYAEALRLAEAEGLSSVCASADVGTLMELGDAARLAGRADRAVPDRAAGRTARARSIRAPDGGAGEGRRPRRRGTRREGCRAPRDRPPARA